MAKQKKLDKSQVKIYFDMDGTLADFDRGMVEIANYVKPREGQLTDEEDAKMWAELSKVEHYYDKLEFMPGAKELFELVYGIYGERCEILTAVPKPHRNMPTAAEDKVAWVRRLLSKEVKVNTVMSQDKPKFCDGENSILIDDYGPYVEAWIAAGGTAIKYTDPESTIKQLKELGVL